MPLIDTGRGIRSQRLRLTPSPDGRQLLVHRSDLHPTVMPTAGALLRHGRVIYDLTRGEPHDARLACGSLFLIDVDSTRLLSRSSSTVAVWDPSSTRIVTVDDAHSVPTPTVWSVDGGRADWPHVRATASLLGFRGRHQRQPGVGWSEDGFPLLLTAAAKRPTRLIRDASSATWECRTVEALWEASTCDLTALTPNGCRPIRQNVVVPAMDLSSCGSTVLLGMITDLAELRRFLETDLLPYWVLQLRKGHPPAWTDVGSLPRDSVRLVDAAPTPTVIYLEPTSTGTVIWDALSGDRLAGLDHAVAAHCGVPGRTGCWASPGSGRLRFAHGDLALPGHIRSIETLPGADLTRFAVNVAGTARVWLVAAQPSPQLEAEPATRTRIYASTTEAQTVDIASDHAAVTLGGSERRRNVTLWGRSVRSVPQRRLRWIDSLPSGPLLSVTAPTSATSRPPLLWLEPVMSADINVPSEQRQINDDPLVPGSPEWCHSGERTVVRAMLPLDWTPTVTFSSIRAKLSDTVAAACAWVAEELPDAQGRYVLGGHSFGAAAAMVAANFPLLDPDCLILRSGAYDRYLSPAGFQWERRSVREAPDLYRGFTVIEQAAAVKCPVLLIHGSEDHNLNTPPVQSRALFDALRAAGRTARFVELLGEGHEIVTRTAAQTVKEQEQEWLEQHSALRPADLSATPQPQPQPQPQQEYQCLR